MRVKYVKTKENVIIVFSELLQHSDFRGFEPVSAGFISIGATDKYEPSCTCYGESISLKLKSDPEIDTELARKQILGYDYY